MLFLSFLEDPPSSLKQNQRLILSFHRGVEHNETENLESSYYSSHSFLYSFFPVFYTLQITLETIPVRVWLYVTK